MTTNIRAGAIANALSTNIEIVDGVGNNRAVVMAATQRRSTINLASPTVDGAAPSQTILEFSDGPYAVYTYRWNDADLPAAAGTYVGTIGGTVTNCSLMMISASDAVQTDIVAAGQGSPATTSMSGTLTSAGLDLSLIFAIQNNTAAVWTHGGGQTLFLDAGNGNDTSGNRVHGGSYEQGETSMTISSTENTDAVWQTMVLAAAGGGGGGIAIPVVRRTLERKKRFA